MRFRIAFQVSIALSLFYLLGPAVVVSQDEVTPQSTLKELADLQPLVLSHLQDVYGVESERLRQFINVVKNHQERSVLEDEKRLRKTYGIFVFTVNNLLQEIWDSNKYNLDSPAETMPIRELMVKGMVRLQSRIESIAIVLREDSGVVPESFP